MQTTAFELGEKMQLHKVDFILLPDLWDNFNFPHFKLTPQIWKEAKFLHDKNGELSEEVKSLPTDKGGIYMFYIKSPVLGPFSEYLVYIGRARYTDGHNLKIRCRKYFYNYNNHKERPKVYRMMKYWGKHLYLKYIELSDNSIIEELEEELINALLPPFNDKIPEKNIRPAKKAF